MRLALAAAALAATALVAGCGDSDGTTATDPASGSSSPAATTPSASVEPVGVRTTCADLYHAPHQWMQHALALVHGSSEDAAATGDEVAAGLAAAEQQALEPLAVDIEVVRAGVEAKAAGGDVDTAAFDKAANRLAGHCELYSD